MNRLRTFFSRCKQRVVHSGFQRQYFHKVGLIEFHSYHSFNDKQYNSNQWNPYSFAMILPVMVNNNNDNNDDNEEDNILNEFLESEDEDDMSVDNDIPDNSNINNDNNNINNNNNDNNNGGKKKKKINQ